MPKVIKHASASCLSLHNLPFNFLTYNVSFFVSITHLFEYSGVFDTSGTKAHEGRKSMIVKNTTNNFKCIPSSP